MRWLVCCVGFWAIACEPQSTLETQDSALPSLSCDDNHPPDTLGDAFTLRLVGTRETDHNIGYKTSIGDLDGDGLSDLLLAGRYSQNIYLVLGSTLAELSGWNYDLDEVATYTFALPRGDGSNEYGGGDVAVFIGAGSLYVSAPVQPALPIAYRVDWSGLETLPPGTYALGDAAAATFHGREPVGTSIAGCDVNGDGKSDVIIGSRYLVLGPVETGAIDVDTRSSLLVWGLGYCGGLRNPYGLRQCADFNSDGIDDLLYECGDVTVYYGFSSMGTGVVNLAVPDVLIAADSEEQRMQATGESLADYGGDGGSDLLVSRISEQQIASGGQHKASDVLLLRGEADFFPSGTILGADEGSFLVHADDELTLGVGASIGGDVNGDGRPDIVIGDPGAGINDPGHVHLRYCPVDDGAYQVAQFAETSYEGEIHKGFGTRLGGDVFAGGDFNGNGVNDLVLPVPDLLADDGVGQVGGVYLVGR
jgi:hypothetical protein